ncbi:RecX family transcriptional regulator [Flavobacteriales bacterium]|nr:RecX family transcriptional regulator [Flavobacteriales bacterium]
MGAKLSVQQALVRAQKYCAYQERCHQEVKSKLYDWGLYSEDVDNIIVTLIQEDFLNEERFAASFVRGKFRIKKWGRIKILAELGKRNITEYCKKKGLEEIEEEDYLSTLKDVLRRRASQEKEQVPYVRNQKLAAYLYTRGFESDLVWKILDEEKD